MRYGEYQGIILYDPVHRGYGVALDYSMWYGDNKYDIKSYGKFVDILTDNGSRMKIEKVNDLD